MRRMTRWTWRASSGRRRAARGLGVSAVAGDGRGGDADAAGRSTAAGGRDRRPATAGRRSSAPRSAGRRRRRLTARARSALVPRRCAADVGPSTAAATAAVGPVGRVGAAWRAALRSTDAVAA